MRTFKKDCLLFSLLVTFILASCSSSKNYYLQPDFKEKKVNSSVLVLPVWRSWFTSFPQHTFGSLTNTGKKVFESSLEPLFSRYTGNSAQTFISAPESDSTNFKISKLAIKGISIDVIIPKENAQINTQNSSTRFVVLLDQFYFRELEKKAMSSTYAGQETGPQEVLYFETNYAYWDTENKKIVAWGKASKSELISKAPTESDYSNLLSKAFKEIVNQGPVKVKP